MPEISNNFRLGRMEKDLDDRLVPNGAYRDALNVEVATSEGSDVGALQKVLGNTVISGLPTLTNATCIGSVRDTQNNKIYWFITSSGADVIAELNGTTIDLILVDTTNVLNFDTSNLILGVNILDQVLYFTDNLNEPRRVDIEYWRGKTGTGLTTSTGLTADKITVIRKSPLNALIYAVNGLPSTVISGAGTLDGDQVQTIINEDTALILSTYTVDDPGAITNITFIKQTDATDVNPAYVVGTQVILTNTLGQTARISITAVDDSASQHVYTATLLEIHPDIAQTEQGNGVVFSEAGLLQWVAGTGTLSSANISGSTTTVYFGTSNATDGTVSFNSANYLGIQQKASGNVDFFSTIPITAIYTLHLALTIKGAPTLSGTENGGSHTKVNLVLQAQYSLDEGASWNFLDRDGYHDGDTYNATDVSGGVNDTTLQARLGAAKSGGTITFTKNITSTQQLQGTKVRFRLIKTGSTNGLATITQISTPSTGLEVASIVSTTSSTTTIRLRNTSGSGMTLSAINPISSGMIVTGTNIPQFTRVASVTYSTSTPDIVVNKVVSLPAGTTLTFSGTYSAVTSSLTEYDAVAKEALGKFQEKFPRFSYRYKYDNNQYSTFAPFSTPAFVPGNYRYLTKDGFNAGMLNSITEAKLTGWNTDISSQFGDTANSLIEEVDILYKTSNDQNVYVVDTIKKSGGNFADTYTVGDDEIYKVLDNMQLLRIFDSVPKKALCQEIIGNRLLYANYTESFDYTGDIEFDIKTVTRTDTLNQKFSLKSNRTYQFGIVLQDTYGRKTPVFTGEGSSHEVDKENSTKNIQFLVKAKSTSLPTGITHFRYFIKETSKEYYNIAVSNYYDDGEGFAYLSIPSADRNKVSENDYLVFKKQSGTTLNFEGTQDANRYKVIDIKNDPPKLLNKDITANNTFAMDFGDKFGSQTLQQTKKPGITPVANFNKIQIRALGETNYIHADAAALLKAGAKIRFKSAANLRYTKVYEVASVRTHGSGTSLTAEVTFKNFFTDEFDHFYDNANNIKIRILEFVTEAEAIGNSNFDGKFFVKINSNKELKDNFDTHVDSGDFAILGSTYNDVSGSAVDGAYQFSGITANSNTFTITTDEVENDGDSKYEDDNFFNNIILGNYIRITDTNFNNELLFANYYKITSIVKTGGSSAAAVFTITLNTNLLVTVGSSDVVRIDIANILDEEAADVSNPAVFEVEPESGLLDLYYETQEAFPISLLPTSDATATGTVDGPVNNSTTVVLDGTLPTLVVDMLVTGTGISSTVKVNTIQTNTPDSSHITLTLSDPITVADDATLTFTKYQALSYTNSINFGNGVESDRIRDDFNAPVMGKGVRVSTVIEDLYAEETFTNRFIFSQIYNSGTGIDRLNQFIIADKITKDINPSHGSIQLIKTRDTDLLALCEDKCFRVQANKDALFTADGNAQVTASSNVLGQIIPYVGEYGISQNPESFAQYGFRAYFTDKERGVVLRLSRDGLSEISSLGMSDFFSDKLANVTSNLFGSYDDRKNSYNLSFTNQANSDTTETISFNEKINGWTSRKSFVPETAISLNNDYFSFKAGSIYKHHSNSTHSQFYGVALGSGVTRCSVKFIMNQPIGQVKRFKTLNYLGDLGWLLNTLTTSESVGLIGPDGFIKKEGKFFATLTGSNSNAGTLNADELQVEGLGTLSSVNGSILTFTGGVNSNLQVGDSIYFLDDKNVAAFTSLGTATAKTATTITVSVTPPSELTTPENKFVLFDKGGVANQSGLLGFFAEVELKHTTDTAAELFSVGSRIV